MKITGVISLALIIIVILYDIIAEILFGIDGTISRFIQITGWQHPTIWLAFGYLLGHFTAKMNPMIIKVNERGEVIK